MGKQEYHKDKCSESDKILLVEGNDEYHVIRAFSNKLSNQLGCFEVCDCGGIENIRPTLDARLFDLNTKIIGVVLDVDNDICDVWNSILDILKTHKYHNHNDLSRPNPEGTILNAPENRPRLGFWLMPNNQDHGMLEDFLIQLADPMPLKCATRCVQYAERKNLTKFRRVHRSKAILHTYLAWQDKPGKPFGLALQSGALQYGSEIARKFTTWLNCLFNPD